MPQTNEIYRRAAEWSAQADAEGFSAAQQAALDAWLGEDLRHLGAYLAVRAALARVNRLGGAAQTANREPEANVSVLAQPVPARRRWVLVGSIAASLVAVVLCGAAWWATSFEAVYATALGETKVIALPDGSQLTMNTATSASVHYTIIARNITLNRGEALFDVAKHKIRPFVVKADKVQVRAVGTSFELASLRDQPLQVMVREGVVKVKASAHADAIVVSAGARAVVGADGKMIIEPVSVGQIAMNLAWRDGYIVFRRQSLGDAAREFGRYNKLRIIVDDPVLARKAVTGRYLATDPLGFAKAVAIFWNLKVTVSQDSVRLTRNAN